MRSLNFYSVRWLVVVGILCWLETGCAAQMRRVETVHHGPGQWELLVEGKPYFVKGVVYNFFTVGDDPNIGTLRDWSILDSDQNGRVDVAYDSWVDQNKNNRQDADEPAVGDWQLLQEMGANTIRVYQMPSADKRLADLYTSPGSRLTFFHAPNRQLFRDLYEKHGVMTIVGHFFGEWTIGSGANWDPGTDYTDPLQRWRLLECIRVMVEEHRNEPYVLMWMIGNENFNTRDHDNAETQRVAFLKLVNEAARLIHALDRRQHPVGICNLADTYLEDVGKYCPDVDILGVNAYSRSFSPIWQKARAYFDRPLLLTEYGLPAFAEGRENELRQAIWNQASWEDIEANRYGGKGVGNSIGGLVFAWSDVWSLAGGSSRHDAGDYEVVKAEEWFGVTSQGDGSKSPFLRQLRASYRMYQKVWNPAPAAEAAVEAPATESRL